MQHPDEGQIHAWLDDASFESGESAIVAAHVESCGVCAERVAEARGLVAASSRILTALDNVPSVRSPVVARPRWTARRYARIAAGILVVIAGAATVTKVQQKDATGGEAMLPISEPVAVPRAMEEAASDATPPATVPEAGKSRARTSPVPDAAPVPPRAIAGATESVAQAPMAVAQSVIADAMATAADMSTASPAPRVTTVDSAAGVRRTEIELRPGVVVVLSEKAGADPALSRLRNAPLKVAAPSSAPMFSRGMHVELSAAAASDRNNRLEWFDRASGEIRTLSGPVTLDELIALREKLPAMKAGKNEPR